MQKIGIILCMFFNLIQTSNICKKDSKECNHLNSNDYDEKLHFIFTNLTMELMDEISDLNNELFELIKFLIDDSSKNIKELDDLNQMMLLYGQNNKIIINKIAKKYKKIQLLIEKYKKNKNSYFFKIIFFEFTYATYAIDFIFYFILFFKNRYLFIFILLLQCLIDIKIFGVFALKICFIFSLFFYPKMMRKKSNNIHIRNH